MYRRRTGLSQKEVGFLLGVRGETEVSRHERFSRETTLIRAFAYELIFQVPAQQLFAGPYERAAHDVLLRARRLSKRLERHSESTDTKRKRAALQSILEASDPDRG